MDGSLVTGDRVDPIFDEQLTPEMIENGSYPSAYHWLAPDIRETLTRTYKKYSIVSTKLYVENFVSEQITVNKWENGTLLKTKIYRDLFKDESIDLGIDLSHTITNLETGQQQDIPLDFIPAIQTEQDSYDVWDDDSNVPGKFESLTTIDLETSLSVKRNLFEQPVNIIIPSRINPYEDYKKILSLKNTDASDVMLSLTGVLITPADGKVYFTSDKESFKLNGGEEAKTEGHYLYYDSDLNGFYETVYVLSPIKGVGEDSYYEVMAIGFNYDGKHDFIPYSKTEVGSAVESLNEFKSVLSLQTINSREIMGQTFIFSKLGNDEDRLFPPDLRDGYEVKDNIFEIRKLITRSDQNAKFSELFYETRHKEFNSVWKIFGGRYARDLAEQVTISIVAGIVAAIVRYFATDAGAMAVYFAIYISLTMITNDVKAREAEAKIRSQTFYTEAANNNKPISLNQKHYTDFWGESIPVALTGHPGTYYAEVKGGQTGNEFLGYVIAAPPDDDRFWGNNNADTWVFIASNFDLAWTDSLPQDVNPDIMSGLDFDYHNLNPLMVSSELYSYNDQEHYTYLEGPILSEMMLELENVLLDYEPVHTNTGMELVEVYRTGPEMVLLTIQRYDSYKLRQNTLGYLEHEITEVTNGSLNSIKPTVSDGVPQYLFTQKDATAPLSPLYSPLIVSSQRYDQLSESRKFGYIFVDIASSETSSTKGIDSTNLEDEEKEFYSAKVPLADIYGAFNYPIESVTLHKVVDNEVISKVLSNSDYEVPDTLQNLYFTDSIENIMDIDSFVPNYEGTEVYYICEIKFAKIIPDDGNLSEENQRNLLAQATMYPILDYFDQYIFAATTAKMIGEIAYTEILTVQSTSRSAIIVAMAGAVAATAKEISKGAVGMTASIGSSLLVTAASTTATRSILASTAIQIALGAMRIVAQTVAEMFEEIIVDGFIEAYFQNLARMLGWTEGVGQLISTLMTTIRETKMFGIFNLGGQDTSSQGGTMFDVDINAQVEQELQHAEITSNLAQLLAERENDPSFSTDEFLRKNKEEIREIMSDFGLVPSRHENILKMAGIIGSGIFAGLSLIVPGISFAGFSLYGFSPMIKHLGGKIDAQGTGATTAMRAALQNARQSITYTPPDWKISRDIDLKTSAIVSTELMRKSDAAATVQSIGSIGYTGSPIEYLVNSKAGDFEPNIYYALGSTDRTFYDPSMAIEQLETKFKLMEYRKQTIDLLSRAKEISLDTEQKIIENPIRVPVEISPELSEMGYAEKDLTLYKFKAAGSRDHTHIWVPINFDIDQIKDYIRNKLNLMKNREIILTQEGEILNSLEGAESLSRIFVQPVQSAAGVNQFTAYDNEDVIIPSWLFDPTFDYRTYNYQNVKGYSGAIRFLATRFEGIGNIVEHFNTLDKAKALGKIVGIIGNINKKLVGYMPETLSSDNLGEWFEGQFFGKVNSPEINQKFIDKGATEGDILRWEDHWRNYFDKRFAVGFGTSPNGNPEDVNSYIASIRTFALYNVIFDKILESYVIEGEDKTISIKDLPAAFDKFLQKYSEDFGQKVFKLLENELVDYFTDVKGLNKLFMKISESFFDDVRNDFISFNKLPTAFIGDILESTIFMTKLLKIISTEYADSNFANFDIFSWVELNPAAPLRGDFNELLGGQDKLVEIFKILDNEIPSESGGPVNARLYDLLVAVFPDLVISFHAKYNRKPSDLKKQDLAADELSTILIDLLLHIRENLDWETKESTLPIRKHTSYSAQTYASNKFEASEIFGIKFQENSILELQHMNGDKKSALHALYKNRVAELINSRLRLNPAKSLGDAIDKIQDLFDDWYAPDSEESQIRDELWALAEDTFDGKPFTKTYIEGVIKTFSNKENLNRMVQVTSSGTVELTKYEALDFLFDSGERLKFEDIPQNLFTYIRGQKVALTKAIFNTLVNVKKKPLIVVRDVFTGELGAVALELINNLPANLREGYAYFDENNKEIVINNVYLNNPEGNRLISRVVFNEFGFSVRDGGKEWFRPYMYVQSVDGYFRLDYYRALGWATGNRFIAFLQQVEDNIMTVPAYQSQIIVDRIKFSPHWLRDVRIRKEENSFLDPDFSSHVNYDFILENSEQFLDRLSLLTDIYDDTHKSSRYLPIDNYDVQVLGAYKDEDGILFLGPGYDDLELGFRTLLIHYLAQFGDTIEANEFALELCSLKKIQENPPITIQNIKFNRDQTRKQWLQNWINIFRTYQFTDSNSPIIKKMNEIIIGREENFMGMSTEFDLDRDNEKFDKRELILAIRVISVLTEIFGNYMFKQMFSGGVIVEDGTVRFMSHPFEKVYHIDRIIKAKFSRSFTIRQRYILDRFTSRFNFILPTDAAIDFSDATISLSEVPVKFFLPMYKKPVDESLHSDFYKVISSKIYEHFEEVNHFKRENLERSWRIQFYDTLMQICKDRGYNSLQLSLADEGFRHRIFSSRFTTDFRKNAFDWLTSRGESWVTLPYLKTEIRLSPEDFRFYFKDDWSKFAASLYLIGSKDVDLEASVESDLRYMQNFIIDALDFIFDLAESAVNKKIYLYVFNTYSEGFGIKNGKKYNPPINPNLNEWVPQRTTIETGYVLDLNDMNSVNEFIEMIPILIGNLLVSPTTFVVREPDSPGLESDQCSFVFNIAGSLLPSQITGFSKMIGPPHTGMRWTGGTEGDYRKSVFFLRWNKILSRHDMLATYVFNDPSKFYEICRRILFTNIDDISYYL